MYLPEVPSVPAVRYGPDSLTVKKVLSGFTKDVQ